MTLTKCPHCGHTVLSVASQCPACSGTLGQTYLGPEHEGELAECRSCGHPVRTRTAVCPHCGMEKPAGRPAAVRVTLPVLAAVLLAAIAISLRQVAFRQAPAAPASQSVVARPLLAAPPLRDSRPADSAVTAPAPQPPRSPPPAVEDETTLQTRWTVDWSNMRRGPSNEAPIVRVLPPGTLVRGTLDKWGWWAIQWQGDTVGYIAGALLRATRPSRTP